MQGGEYAKKLEIEYKIQELERALDILRKGSFKSVYVELGGVIIEMDPSDAVSVVEEKIASLRALLSKL